MRVYVCMYKLFCPNMTGIVDSPKKSCDLDKTPGLVTCFGELLIDFVPNVSGVSLAEAPAFKKAPGGAPANVAVGIARLGGSAAFIGKVTVFSFLSLNILILGINNALS